MIDLLQLCFLIYVMNFESALYLNDFVGIVEQFNNRVCAANILDAQATVPRRIKEENSGHKIITCL